MSRVLRENFLLLLWGSLLSSWLLGSLLGRLLCGLLCWFLCSLLCWFLSLLSCGLLGSLLSLWLLCLLDLLWLLDLDNLEAASSLSSGLSSLECSLGDSTLEGKTDLSGSLGSIHLVVGHNVLEDGLAGGASAGLEGCDGSSNHHRVFGVGGRGLGLGGLLGFGCSSVRHVVCW